MRSDTLIVKIDEDFLTVFPRIHFSANSDTADLPISKNRIEIIKNRYWDINSPEIDSDTYEYVPMTLNLRSGNTYAIIEYVLANKEISISVDNNFKPDIRTDSILCKYKSVDGILFSFDEYQIGKHNLKKEEN